jgi:hypothetical protein
MHVELAEAPTAVEYIPPPQVEQAADPANTLYVPATHAAHEPPSGPVDPTLQVQLVTAELRAGELEFDGQLLHVELPEAAVEYVPAAQSEQAADPVNVLFFPTTHTVHGRQSGVVGAVRQS